MSGTIVNSPTTIMRRAQEAFLLQGGLFAAPLARMREEGLLQDPGVYVEYPKMLYVKTGEYEDVQCFTEDVKGKSINWTEKREIIHSTMVHSEEEEERVLNGGKTAAQIEDERLALQNQAKTRGIRFDPSWSLIRLQKELGVPTGESDPKFGAVFDEVENLKEQVRRAEEALSLRAKLKELQAQLDAPEQEDEVSAMQRQLSDLGVKVDRRWSEARLREELDKATRP